MNKLLLSCLIIMCSMTSCVKTGHRKETFTITPQSHMISFHDCPEFTGKSESPLHALIIACHAARFEHYTIFFEDVSDTLYTIRVSADYGFATLWIDTNVNTCVLDFFCVDDRYIYGEFLEAFMAEFKTIKRNNTFFDDLLEMYD